MINSYAKDQEYAHNAGHGQSFDECYPIYVIRSNAGSCSASAFTSCCSPTVRFGPLSRMGTIKKREKGDSAKGNMGVGTPWPLRAAQVMPMIMTIDVTNPSQAIIHAFGDGPIENVTNWFRWDTRVRSLTARVKKPDSSAFLAFHLNAIFLPSIASSVRHNRPRPDVQKRMHEMSQRDTLILLVPTP